MARSFALGIAAFATTALILAGQSAAFGISLIG
jgi:hypothetical protein